MRLRLDARDGTSSSRMSQIVCTTCRLVRSLRPPTLYFAPLRPQIGPIAAGRFEQRVGAEDIRSDEVAGAGNRAVDVTFSGKVHHGVGSEVVEGDVERCTVAYVGAHERVARMIPDGVERT